MVVEAVNGDSVMLLCTVARSGVIVCCCKGAANLIVCRPVGVITCIIWDWDGDRVDAGGLTMDMFW